MSSLSSSNFCFFVNRLDESYILYLQIQFEWDYRHQELIILNCNLFINPISRKEKESCIVQLSSESFHPNTNPQLVPKSTFQFTLNIEKVHGWWQHKLPTLVCFFSWKKVAARKRRRTTSIKWMGASIFSHFIHATHSFSLLSFISHTYL